MEYNLAEKRMTPNVRMILEDRYLRKDKDGNIIETPDQMYLRVAEHIANGNEELVYMYYCMMAEGDMLPNSPTLVNAGIDGKGCLSACFVRSPEDTMESIMAVVSDSVMIEKWGGGIGYGVSALREKDAPIKTTHGKALGAIETLKILSYNAGKITQGSFRRGAHMGQMLVSHPEIREFIHCKDTFEELQNFNISVQITDEFMQAVLDEEPWFLISPKDGHVTASMDARDLWQEICESAHATGDPGIAFIDRVWETAPNPQLGKIMTSNPCGEEYLEDGNSCCLGSINLAKFILPNGKGWDYARLDKIVHMSVNFLNGVIDVNEFPLQSLRDMNLATRRIGLGVMGWADALIALGIPYDSQEALDEAKNIGSVILASAWDASAILAKRDGPYPEWENSALNIFGARPVRNSSVITIAPTGTISRLANCSSGIEPLFALVWESNILWKDDEGLETTKVLDCAKGIKEAIERYEAEEHAKGLEVIDILESFKHNKTGLMEFLWNYGLNTNLYRTALEITPDMHLRMQAAWQENTTNSVSKTINAPNGITVDEIKEIYLQAWQLKCKGVTIYRSGTREFEVLSPIENIVGEMLENTIVSTEEKPQPGNVKRPHSVYGVTDTWNTGHGKLLTTINWNGKPHEVIANGGKAGGCETAFLETIARLISLALQKGIAYEDIAYQMNGITCCPAWDEGHLILSPSDAIARSMRDHFAGIIENQEENTSISIETEIIKAQSLQKSTIEYKKCPKCNGRMIPLSGCPTCEACGLGKCD